MKFLSVQDYPDTLTGNHLDRHCYVDTHHSQSIRDNNFYWSLLYVIIVYLVNAGKIQQWSLIEKFVYPQITGKLTQVLNA